jgi:hypothetical protein
MELTEALKARDQMVVVLRGVRFAPPERGPEAESLLTRSRLISETIILRLHLPASRIAQVLKYFYLKTHILMERVTLNPNVNDVRVARVQVVAGGEEDTDVHTLKFRRCREAVVGAR